MEIERKFLVSELPADLDRDSCEVIEQGYIAITDDGLEVRIRRHPDRDFLTIKQGEGGTRLEEELEIDAERAERLWPLTDGRRLEKTRCVIPAPGGLTFELDVYAGELEGLATVEVEFSSEQAAGSSATRVPPVRARSRSATRTGTVRGAGSSRQLGVS